MIPKSQRSKSWALLTGLYVDNNWRSRLPLLILAGWEAATRLGLFPAYTLPAPSTVLQTLYLEARSGELWVHIAASTWRVLTGFTIGTAIAVALGTVVGLSAGIESLS